MKKVIVVYDDSRKPNQEISSITGRKSYGNIIFKRVSLKDRMKNKLSGIDFVEDFVFERSFSRKDSQAYNSDASVFKIYSNYEIIDLEEVSVLLEKAIYAKEPYSVMCNDGVAAVIYPSINEYFSSSSGAAETEYEKILSKALVDLSEVNNFRTFITSGFDARFFNALAGDEYTVVKSSNNIEKLRREYTYFTLLPPGMKQWFASVYDYREDDKSASYTMERYHMTDLALRYVHGAIGEEEFRAIMERLFYFISIREKKQVTAEEYRKNEKELYVDKVDERIELLKSLPEFKRIEQLIATGTTYAGIDEIIEKYKKLYETVTGNKQFHNVLVVGHGDLCFSNILYNHDAKLLRLIDPKGSLDEEGLYMNPYYDIAKLSHSVWGAYDYFNSNLYEISMDSELKMQLCIDDNNDKYIEIFREYLKKNDIDERLIRIYEASLFLSMLPLHIDREKKVFGFILNAINILEQLEEK